MATSDIFLNIPYHRVVFLFSIYLHQSHIHYDCSSYVNNVMSPKHPAPGQISL